VALACFLAARLASERTLADAALAEPTRAARYAGAKGWLGTLALPPALRNALARCLEASVSASPASVGREVAALAAAAAPYLDPASRGELETLAATLGG
jgi:hypothetical protein